MLRPGTFSLTLLLSFLTALGPLTMDMYLPSLPAIGQALDASTVQVQLTISSYLIGFAAGQIVYGPVSDRIGRRPVILAALVLYGVATIVCAVAQSIEVLIAVRFVQALGGAGCIVLARAAVRDLYSGVRAGRELSLMGSITAFAPIVAPAIGGVLQTAFGWRASFYAAGGLRAGRRLGCGAAIAGDAAPTRLGTVFAGRHGRALSFGAGASRLSGQSRHPGRFLRRLVCLDRRRAVRDAGSVRTDADRIRHDLRGRRRRLHGRRLHGASRFVMRLGLDRTIGIGAVVMVVGGLAMAAAVALGLAHVGWLVGTMTIYLAGMGLVLPQTQAGALTPFPDRAGTASSLLGFAQQTAAAIAAVAIGHYLGRSAWPVAGTIAVMGVLALLIWALTRRVRTAPMFNA